MKKAFYLLWFAAITATFLYSFTQIDLSLTIARFEFIRSIQEPFQYIGYFNRPASALLFILLTILLFSAYLVTLFGIIKNKLLRRDIWMVIIFSTIVLIPAYNAFSYDIFNYIFDAKIYTEYGDNPYIKKALDYPEDPMLPFMRWTHRTYPYGPTWLIASVPLSYISFGYFLPAFFLFKFLAAAAFIGTAYVIEQIAILLKRKKALFPLALFALNPLVLVETLVSGHNDILMLFFGASAILMYIERKYVLSTLSILLSIGIKYATFLMLPALGIYKIISKKENYDLLFLILTIFLLLATCAATIRTVYQPWYLLYPLLPAVFLEKRLAVLILIFILSLVSFIQYLPYIYFGHWDPPVHLIMLIIIVTGLVLSLVLILLLKLFKVKGRV